MFYIGLILILIGAWQAYAKGSMSQIISSIFLTLGIILIFVGDYKAGLFFVFMFASWFLLMKIFSFSTYHKYFLKMVLVLGLYAFIIGFLIYKLNFEVYFWWYLILTSIFLVINHNKQHKTKSLLSTFEGKEKVDFELSLKNTIKYHLLSSIVFIILFILGFIYTSNIFNF